MAKKEQINQLWNKKGIGLEKLEEFATYNDSLEKFLEKTKEQNLKCLNFIENSQSSQ
jgi:hypothetical protein